MTPNTLLLVLTYTRLGTVCTGHLIGLDSMVVELALAIVGEIAWNIVSVNDTSTYENYAERRFLCSAVLFTLFQSCTILIKIFTMSYDNTDDFWR